MPITYQDPIQKEIAKKQSQQRANLKNKIKRHTKQNRTNTANFNLFGESIVEIMGPEVCNQLIEQNNKDIPVEREINKELKKYGRRSQNAIGTRVNTTIPITATINQ